MRVPVGGWSWSLPSGFADPEDTSFALKVLLGSGAPPGDEAIVRGIRWLRATQGSKGAWGIVRNARRHEDGACSVFTSGVVNSLHAAGVPAGDRIIVRALAWFAGAQRSDGTIPCAWYRDNTAGTAAALDTFGQVGQADHPVAQRCLRWLLDTQRTDGGWGNGDPAIDSTAEETAWSLLGLLAARAPQAEPAIHRGIRWLLDARESGGLWTPALVGTYAKGTSYYADDLFPMAFALRALARCQKLGLAR